MSPPNHPGTAIHHSLMGSIDPETGIPFGSDEADLVAANLPIALPVRMPAKAPPTYCDICGRVGEHDPDCPSIVQREAAEAVAAMDLEDELAAESIPLLLRRVCATALRRLAKRLEGPQ